MLDVEYLAIPLCSIWQGYKTGCLIKYSIENTLAYWRKNQEQKNKYKSKLHDS